MGGHPPESYTYVNDDDDDDDDFIVSKILCVSYSMQILKHRAEYNFTNRICIVRNTGTCTYTQREKVYLTTHYSTLQSYGDGYVLLRLSRLRLDDTKSQVVLNSSILYPRPRCQ